LIYNRDIGNFLHRQSNDSAQEDINFDRKLQKNTTGQWGRDLSQVESIVVDVKHSASKSREASKCLSTTEFFCLSGDEQQKVGTKTIETMKTLSVIKL
jgi:hypothetical protein